MDTGSSLSVVLLLACAAGLVFALREVVSARRALDALSGQQDRALAAQAASARIMQVSAAELRELALGLLGLSDTLRSERVGATVHARAVSAASAQILEVADRLQDGAFPAPRARVITDEALCAGTMLHEAVAAVAANLGPGCRNWRIAPELSGVSLTADRRGLAQVFLRVLSNAARFTRDGDWIDVGLERHAGGATLVIADEGAGPAAVAGSTSVGRDDWRGLGPGLSLARALIEAHGGTLTLEAAARVGTRVSLAFPAARVTSERPEA